MKLKRRRTKGAISIFLVMITVGMLLLSAVLIDGSRMASARAITQGAADLAAASALSAFNEELKNDYGLFAMDDTAKVEQIYKDSLSNTLIAYGLPGEGEYSDKIWDILKTQVTGSKSYSGESFLNLYDFRVDSCEVEPLYSLANQDVLENQMVEYAKFRGVYVAVDRLDLFRKSGEIKKSAEKNQETADVMEDKMEVDEGNADVEYELSILREQIRKLEEEKNSLIKTVTEDYKESLRAKMEEIRQENVDSEEELSREEKRAAGQYENRKKKIKEYTDKVCLTSEKLIKQVGKVLDEVEKAIRALETFKGENSGKAAGNEAVQSLIAEAEENIELYKNKYIPYLESLEKDPDLTEWSRNRTDYGEELQEILGRIDQAIEKYVPEFQELSEAEESEPDAEEAAAESGEADSEEAEPEEEPEFYFYAYNLRDKSTDIDDMISDYMRKYNPAVVSRFGKGDWNENFNPGITERQAASGDTGGMDQDSAKEISGSRAGKEDPSKGNSSNQEKGSVPGNVYQSRPSKNFQADSGTAVNTDFYNEANNLTASQNAMKQDSFLAEFGEAARDDILGMTYMFGTFKSRMTGVQRFSGNGMPVSEKDNFYMPPWRYAHPEGELDMRFEPKKNRSTVLRSELEYLIYGNQSDTANEAAVYATIFAERMANNMIALYLHGGVKASCHTAALAASAATVGVVPEPVFFWIFLTAWSTAETTIEMDYLINKGYQIPLFKTKGNLLLSGRISDQGVISNYGEQGIFVTYEDYLLILLVISGRENRIMRTADLIEMNMKKNHDPVFTMAGAYTYLKADTALSIRYLFGNVMPFQESYENQGLGGRMKFHNTIYQGY